MQLPASEQELRDLIVRAVCHDLRELDLRGATFFGANLMDAWLAGADMTGADLGGARVDGADFTRVIGLTAKQRADLKKRGAIVDEPDRPLPSLIHALNDKGGRRS